MKYTGKLAGSHRQRHVLISQPVKLSSIDFDDFYEEVSDHWQDKARSLQARRWRKIRNQAV